MPYLCGYYDYCYWSFAPAPVWVVLVSGKVHLSNSVADTAAHSLLGCTVNKCRAFSSSVKMKCVHKIHPWSSSATTGVTKSLLKS